MKHTLRIAALVAVIAFVIIGCKSPTSSDPEYVGVKGRVAGVVTDSVTGLPIADVKVTISGEAGYEEWTDENGTFLIEDVTPGYYAVVYTKEGYEPFIIGAPDTSSASAIDTSGNYGTVDGASAGQIGTVVPNIETGNYLYVSPVQYKVDDPFGEWYALQAELAAFAESGYETFGLTNGWSFTEGDNTYQYTSSGGAITANYNAETKTFTFSGSAIGQREYTYGITLGVRPLAPLDSAIQGKLIAVFKGADNLYGAGREEAEVAGTEDAPIKVYFQAGDAATPRVYGPALITTSDGVFKFEGLPSGKPVQAIYVDGFSQTDAAGATYWFNGKAFWYDDSGNVEDLLATNSSGFEITRPHELSVIGDVYISPVVGDALIAGHNIGLTGKANPIAVDGTIELSFNKPIAPSSFTASFVPFDQSTTLSIGVLAAQSTAQAIPLVGTWSADGTSVSLRAVGVPTDDTPALLGEPGFPFTYSHFALNAWPTGYLDIQTGQALDGSPLRKTVDTISVGGLTANKLVIYTEPVVQLEKTEFLAPGAEGARAYEAYGKLPFAGTLKLTFTQDLAADSKTYFELFELPDGDYTNDAQITAALGAAVKVLTIDGDSPNDYAISGKTVSIQLNKVLSRTSLHVIKYSVYTTKPNGGIVDAYTVPFSTGDDLTLVGTNLYDPASNIYYVAAPARDEEYFGLTGDLILSFDKDIPVDAKLEAELYLAADASAATSSAELKKKNLLAAGALSVSGKDFVIANPGLYKAGEYVLAAKITSAAGDVLFNTKSEVFSYYTRSNDYPGISPVPPYKYTSGLVNVENVGVDGVTTSPYILFSATGGFTAEDYNLDQTGNKQFATNIGVNVSSLTGGYVSGYNYNGVNYAGNGVVVVVGDFAVPAFPGEESIIIEFSEDLAATGHTAKLYLWNDANGNNVIEGGEMLPPSTLGVAVNGKIITLTPAGVLAPDRKFVLELTVKSLSGVEMSYGDENVADHPYLVFRVEDEFVVSDSRLKTIATTDITPRFNSLTNAGTFSVKPIVSGTDDGQNTYSLPNVYRSYNLNTVTGKYDSSGFGPEIGYTETIYGSPFASVSATIPGALSNLSSDSGIWSNILVNGGTTKYIIRGFDKYGFVYTSTEQTVEDNVSPIMFGTIDFGVYGFAPIAWVPATATGVTPSIPAHMEVAIPAALTGALGVSGVDLPDVITFIQDGPVELLRTGSASGVNRINVSGNGYVAIGNTSANPTATGSITITPNFPASGFFAGQHDRICFSIRTSSTFTGVQAGDWFTITAATDTSGNAGIFTAGANSVSTIRFVFQ